MTALAQHIKSQIAANGPITLAEYMQTCLLHPEHGYYTYQTAIGAKGDFTTAPEISQMFGELIGLCLAQTWLTQGASSRFTLAELGPGRGTLMSDILRATKSVPGFHAAADIHLVEAAPRLRSVQSESLSDVRPYWHDTVDDLPEDIPLFLVANEFFDALPIRQFQRDGSAWRERVVGLKDEMLAIGLSNPAPVASLQHRLEDTKDGDIVETCAPAATIMSSIGTRIANNGGTALIVDYGDWRSLGDTFQAVKNHKTTDPLSVPGLADLTAHVDFEALATAASPACHTRLSTQGVFLERLGITPRAQALADAATGTAINDVIAAHRRLTHPSEMGTVFKALGLYPKGQQPPPGLET